MQLPVTWLSKPRYGGDTMMHYVSKRTLVFTAFLIAFSLILPESVYTAEQWPQFRGPAMNPAVEDNPNLPDQWSTTDNVEWSTDIPGLGWSSPIVWGNKVFLTTVDAAAEYERPREGLYNGLGRPIPPDVEHVWLVYCLDLETGDVLWRKQVHEGKPVVSRHPKNTYASDTPTTDGERVYALFGDLGLYCFDMDGNEQWHVDIEPRKTMNNYGAAASPVVHDGKVIMIYDNNEDSYIAAYDAKSGKEVWRTPREEEASWASPFVWENEKRTEIITTGQNRIRSYDLSGNLLWDMDGKMSWACIATPFAAHGMVYVNSGYFQDEHRPVYAIRPGASGTIGLKEGEKSNEHIAWYQPETGNYNTSPLVYGDYYYTVYDLGGFECYNALTGEQLYAQKKLATKGRSTFTASPWAYNGKVFCLSEQGDTYVIKAGPEYELLGKNSLGEMCISSPAIVGDRLLIRTVSKLYSIKK
jgi:outer membrane protein assembly factor BamB